MRWNGETTAQTLARERRWHGVFALFPTQMDSGEWVWLETYWRRLPSGLTLRWQWHRALEIPSDADQPQALVDPWMADTSAHGPVPPKPRP